MPGRPFAVGGPSKNENVGRPARDVMLRRKTSFFFKYSRMPASSSEYLILSLSCLNIVRSVSGYFLFRYCTSHMNPLTTALIKRLEASGIYNSKLSRLIWKSPGSLPRRGIFGANIRRSPTVVKTRPRTTNSLPASFMGETPPPRASGRVLSASFPVPHVSHREPPDHFFHQRRHPGFGLVGNGDDFFQRHRFEGVGEALIRQN